MNNLSLSRNPSHEFYTTENVEEFAKVSKKLLGHNASFLKEIHRVSLVSRT